MGTFSQADLLFLWRFVHPAVFVYHTPDCPCTITVTTTDYMKSLMLDMDCDDFMLLLAGASHHDRRPPDQKRLELHALGCPSCAELEKQLQDDDDTDTPPDILIGRSIGPYLIKELIGTGGMGRVYLAAHPEIGSRVAIKIFSKDWNTHPELVARFFAEARATNVIAHENIVNVLDVGRFEDERPFMVMEYLAGAPLARLIASNSLSDSQIRTLMLDVLGALSAAHEHNIIHRDLKPDNIFVSPEGRATLLDFGIAKLIPEIVGDSAPTATGTILGTPHYMSPEQAIGDPVDFRTDVYAMGIILYECFTGERPFQGNSLFRLLDQHINRTPVAPRSIRPDLGDDIEALILKAIAKVPSDRHVSVAEMRAELEACLSLQGSSADITRNVLTPTPLPRGLPSTSDSSIASPRPTPPKEEPQPLESKPSFRTWLIVGGILSIAGISLVAFNVSTAVNTANYAQPAEAPDATTLAQNITDASALDAASELPEPVDAAAQTVPSISKIRVTPPTTKIRHKGIAPLSMLDKATRLARQNRDDAVLLRVQISGLNLGGRIELGQPGREVRFDFLSPRKARSVTRATGACIVSVVYTGSAPSVSQRNGTCATLRPVITPRCSMNKILQKGRKSNAFPTPKMSQLVDAKMEVSRGNSARTFWKLDIDGVNINIPGC